LVVGFIGKGGPLCESDFDGGVQVREPRDRVMLSHVRQAGRQVLKLRGKRK
jgi:hypothetical protein